MKFDSISFLVRFRNMTNIAVNRGCWRSEAIAAVSKQEPQDESDSEQEAEG
jgi:hypothetical protein